MVSREIGFHFGFSTGSLPLTTATMLTSTPRASMTKDNMRGADPGPIRTGVPTARFWPT